MNRKGFSFKNNRIVNYDSRDKRDIASFPPFPASELNTTDPTNLGCVVMDDKGRVYMKVRHASTTAGTRGAMAAIAASVDSALGAVAETTNYQVNITTSLNNAANQVKGWTMGIVGSTNGVGGATATQASVLRDIYSNTQSATPVLTYSEARRDILNGNATAIYDGNQMPAASAGTNYLSASQDVALIRPMYDVQPAVATAGPAYTTLQCLPVGVYLAAVTATSTDAYENRTFYYTWIQIFGPGLVLLKASTAATVNLSMLVPDTDSTTGALTVAIASASVSQMAASIGVALCTDTPGDAQLLPTFINPGYARMGIW